MKLSWLKKVLSIFLSVLVIVTIFPTGIKASAVGNHKNFTQWYSNSIYYQQLQDAINLMSGNQRDDILKVAESQRGYTEGDRKSDVDGTSNQDRRHPNNNYTEYNYWYWGVYGGKNYAWCAAFVSWCARQANIPTSIIPNIAYVPNYFNNKAFTIKRTNYEPQPGDIFLTKDKGHVGLVLSVDKDAGTIQTIEGNSDSNGSYEGWSVVSRRKSISSFYYAVPNYTNNYSQTSVNKSTICGKNIKYPNWIYYGYTFNFSGNITSTLPITSACIIIEKRKNVVKNEYELSACSIVKDFRNPLKFFSSKKTLDISKEFSGLDTSTLSTGIYRIRIGVSCGLSKLKLYNKRSLLYSDPSDAFVMLYDGTFQVKSRTRSATTFKAITTNDCSYSTIANIVLTEGYSTGSSNSNNHYYNGSSLYPVGIYKVSAKSGLNARKQPNANSARLSGWSYGDVVNVTATDGNWGYTSRGWICLDYTSFVTSATSSYDSNVSYGVGNYMVTAISGLNCRRGVGTNYSVIKTLTNGTQFSVTETDGAWGYSPEHGGWLCLQYASYVSALSPSLPVPALPNLSTTTSSEIGVNEVISFKWDAVDTAELYNVKLIDANTNKEVQSTTVTGTNASFKTPYAGTFNVSVSASNSQHTGLEATLYGFTAKAPSTVTFKDWDGKVISTQEVAYGKDATAPTAPSRVGHTFTKWDGSYTQVRETQVVTATYTKNKYKVAFCDYDGSVISTQDVYYGDAATAPEYTAPTGYSFVKWDTSFKNITKATTVKAVISWTSLYPLEISTTSAVERQNKSYIVTSIVNNSPNAVNNARIIAVLKTKENKLLATVQSENISLAKGEVKNLTLTASYEGMATKAEIFVVKADNENIPLAKQLEKLVYQGTAWSAWSTSTPPSDALQVESRTEYRYRDKDLKTSSSSTLNGYTQCDHTYTWSDWSSWSAWQDTKVSSNLSENVEQQVNVRTQSVDNYNSPITETRYSYKTVYHYFRYSTKYEGPKDSGYTYGSYTYQASGTQYYEYTSDTEYTRNSTYDQSGLKAYNRYYNSTNYNTVWACSPYSTQEVASSWQETVGYNKKTQYSYQTRNKNHTYYFYKWGDWSSWNPEVVNGTDSREVETRTTYRYLANTANNIETTAGNFVERNGTVDKSYANRQSLLFVMDKNGTTQFVGQTVVGADGSYAFKFKTKDEPTVTSGDYKVMLSIEGTSAAFELEPIKAPVPEYTVKFVDYDGTVVSEQTVEQGKDAAVPAPLSREGYRFIGWDKSFTNIQNDLIVTAQYEIKSFDVVFIDEINNTTMLERYNYGDTIVVPVIAENEKYNFLGWDAVLDGNTIVKDNIVVTAKYELKKFTVEVLGFDGEVIQSQIIDFGEPVVLPELKSRDNYIFVSWNVPGDINYVTENITVTPYFEYTNTVATPTSSIETGTYEGDQLVTLSCETEGADIYYTLDGSDPLQEIENSKARSVQINGMLYTGPFKLDSSANLIYAAVKDGMNSSNYDFKTLAVNTADSEIKQYTVTINYGIYDTMDTKLINAGEKVVLDDYELYNYGYTLIGVYTDEAMTKAWNLEKDTVNGEMTLYLNWSQDSYTVTFKDSNDHVIEEQDVLYGEDAVAPMWNDVEGYIFTGWDTEYTNVVSDIEVKATYISFDDVTSVEFDKETLSIVEGQSDTITAIVKLGTDCENDALIWQSSDEDVAIVDDNGKITAVAAGAATIFAVSEDSGMSAQCEVTVNYKDPCSVLGHKHEGKVTAPTCTEKGYTTYICSVCGDTYTANEKASLGHNMSEIITIVSPSCENEGQDMIKCSRCDYSEIQQTEATGHSDNDGNNACDDCGKELSASSKCSCNCHKTGFMGIIWKILKFFYKLFKINSVCECGVAHY